MTTKDEVRSTVEAFRTERALKLALEALESVKHKIDSYQVNVCDDVDEAITAIREALADQPRLLSAAPCDQCGYNGPGYYQSGTHQCAAKHHKALADSALKRMAENERELGLDYMEPAQQQHTYASTQATMCAGCGEHKHTPLRIDTMGGYVCLTCIDQKLGSLLGEFGYPQPAQQEPVAWVCHGVNDQHDVDFYENEINALPVGTMLYTSPPASPSQGDIKPWVGLDSQDFDGVIKSDAFEAGAYWANNILREKNENMEKNA